MRRRISLAVLALAAFTLGCSDQSSPTAPGDLSGIVAGESSAASNGGADVDQDGLIVPAGTAVINSGTFTLTRSAEGLWLTAHSEDFVVGDAYTIWAAIFDNPHGCVGGPGGCNGGDFGVRQAQATISNFGGFVVDGSKDIAVHLGRHDASRQTLGGLGRSGIDNPLRAEVHLIFQSHGLAQEDPDDLAEQTSMVGAQCNPTCEDQAAVLFFPPGPPGKG